MEIGASRVQYAHVFLFAMAGMRKIGTFAATEIASEGFRDSLAQVSVCFMLCWEGALLVPEKKD